MPHSIQTKFTLDLNLIQHLSKSLPLPPAQLLPFQTAAFAEQLPSQQCLLQSQWPYHASLQEDSRTNKKWTNIVII